MTDSLLLYLGSQYCYCVFIICLHILFAIKCIFELFTHTLGYKVTAVEADPDNYFGYLINEVLHDLIQACPNDLNCAFNLSPSKA